MIKPGIWSGALVGAVLAAGAAFAAGPSNIEIVDGGIPKALTADGGSAERGREVVINRKLGNCLACHKITALSDQPYHGEVAPPLDGAATRWSEAELRMIVVDARKVFEGTMMPGFHTTEGLNRVLKKFEGKTILSAQDVEDVVAFLMTLNEE
ncbi:sulfur oxidation c-type cytochrome SoxX [Hwanghaeella sp.]|uniref:sulfur oxidation c-type cytochrome SoxX n=1 Tax=Hwanghaeella sp. TaxID=2605943 RepID=UPI003CCC3F21